MGQKNGPDPDGEHLPDSTDSLEEQRRYWARDLRLKKIGLAISAAGFILIVGGFIANYLQLRLNTTQTEKLAKSVRITVGDSVTTHVTKLDDVFMKDPSLMPYFYEGKTISKTDKDYPKVSATAEMVLDVFDLVVSQNKNFPEFWDAPQAW